MKNRWVSNIKEAIDDAQRSMSSADMPTYLIIGGRRIPFEVASVALRRRADVPYEDYDLEIEITSSPMNETIEDIVREMRDLGKLDEKSSDTIPRRLMGLGLRTYADRISAALTAPPRNCDVGTEPEQIERFIEFCDSYFNGNDSCGNCPLWVSGTFGRNCQIKWSQMPYVAKKGGAK